MPQCPVLGRVLAGLAQSRATLDTLIAHRSHNLLCKAPVGD
jgi:hypothetical protein